MMKKLLVLALVLSVASLATAALDLNTISGVSYEVSGNTVTVSGTNVTGYLFNLQADNGSELSNAVVDVAFGTKSAGSWKSAESVWALASASNSAGDITGTIFSINFTPGTQKIYFVYSSFAADISNLTLSLGTNSIPLTNDYASGVENAGYFMSVGSIVPEPATMAILGLGGLLLARRKK